MASAACCTPAPPAEHVDEGTTGTIGGLPAYFNNPTSKAAIIFASDVFGYNTPLVRKLADKVAAAGFYVVGPDFSNGDPFVPKDLSDPFADVGPWLAIHHPMSERVLEYDTTVGKTSRFHELVRGSVVNVLIDLFTHYEVPESDASIAVAKTIIKELKEQGVESIGFAGFCWGARIAVMIGKEEGLLKGIFLQHPSFTTKENIEDLKVPTSILGSEIDDFTPPSLVLEFKEILATKPFPSFVKIFPGQSHGWTIRYDVNDPHQVKGAEEAHADLLEFAKKVLL